jgi:hypothetical protein
MGQSKFCAGVHATNVARAQSCCRRLQPTRSCSAEMLYLYVEIVLFDYIKVLPKTSAEGDY